MLNRASEYLALVLQNKRLVELLRKEYPEEFNRVNWSQELILELFYSLADWEKERIKRNFDIAAQNENLEVNQR